MALSRSSHAEVDSVLRSAATPRDLRRSLLANETIGRSPHPLVETAAEVAIDGLYDLAALAAFDPLHAEADLDSALPADLAGLSRSLSGRADGEQAARLLDERALALLFRPGSALSLDSVPLPGEAPPALPPILAEFASHEGLPRHLAAEFTAIVGWIRAVPAEAGERWARAVVTTTPAPATEPPPAQVHAVLRGEPAAPATAALTISLLAESAGLQPTISQDADEYVVVVDGRSVRLTPCGARVSTPRPSPATTWAPARLEPWARAEVAASLLRDEDVALDERVSRIATLQAPAESAACQAIGSARAAGPNAAIVAWWQVRLGHPDAARDNLQRPTVGAAERVRIAALAALGEPVSAGASTTLSCRDAAVPWPGREASP